MALVKLYGQLGSFNTECGFFMHLFVKGRCNTYIDGQKAYLEVFDGDINCPNE